MPIERVQVTEPELREALQKGHCHAYVAISDGKCIAYMLYYYAYSTWEGRYMFMEDLYVKPEFRKRGLGKALWRQAAKAGYLFA